MRYTTEDKHFRRLNHIKCTANVRAANSAYVRRQKTTTFDCMAVKTFSWEITAHIKSEKCYCNG